MVRRIAVVAILVGAGLAVAPASASADPPSPFTWELCEGVAYYGVTTVGAGPTCVPSPFPPGCNSGFTSLGSLGLLWDEICLPLI